MSLFASRGHEAFCNAIVDSGVAPQRENFIGGRALEEVDVNRREERNFCINTIKPSASEVQGEYECKSTRDSLKTVQNLLADFYIYFLLSGNTIFGLTARKKHRTLEVRLDEKLLDEPGVLERLEKRHLKTEMTTCALVLDDDEIEKAWKEFVHAERTKQYSSSSKILLQVVITARLQALRCAEDPFEVGGTDILEKDGSIATLLRNEMFLIQNWATMPSSPRASKQTPIDILTFVNTYTYHIKMLLRQLKCPENLVKQAFESLEARRFRKKKLKESQSWSELISRPNTISLTWPEKLFDDYIKYLLKRGDRISLWVHFCITTMYHLMCRPEVLPKLAWDMLVTEKFGQETPDCTIQNFIGLNINSDVEKNAKFHNFVRRVFSSQTMVHRNNWLSLALLLAKVKAERERSEFDFSACKKDLLQNYFKCLGELSKLHKSRMNQFFADEELFSLYGEPK